MSDADLDHAVDVGEFVNADPPSDKCIISGKPATEMAVFSQAY